MAPNPGLPQLVALAILSNQTLVVGISQYALSHGVSVNQVLANSITSFSGALTALTPTTATVWGIYAGLIANTTWLELAAGQFPLGGTNNQILTSLAQQAMDIDALI